MSEEFKPIESQEQLDNIIKDRLQINDRSWSEKYSGYLSPDEVASKTKELDDEIAKLGNSLNEATEKAKTDAETIKSLTEKVKTYETASVKSRIAHEIGIPYELANKLSGETEEEIRKDAESLKPFVTQKIVPPLRDPESRDPGSGDDKKDGLRKLANSFKKE